MTAPEPILTDDVLRELAAGREAIRLLPGGGDDGDWTVEHLARELLAAREVLREVVGDEPRDYEFDCCSFTECKGEGTDERGVYIHDASCPITRARALLPAEGAKENR